MHKERKVLKVHALFLSIYFITILFLLLDQAGALPIAEVLRKIKYVYIFVTLFLCIGARMRKADRCIGVVLLLLFLHTLVFGFLIPKRIVLDAVHEHATQMLVFLTMTASTFMYVYRHAIFRTFLNITYFATAIRFIIIGWIYREHFVNPVWGIIQTFRGVNRYKSTFGFVHSGYLANELYLLLVLSILVYEFNKHKAFSEFRYYLAVILVVDLLGFMMLIASAQRSGVVSVALAYMIYFIGTNTRIFTSKLGRLILVIAATGAVIFIYKSGMWEYVWQNSNRVLNIEVNYPVFKEIGDIWTGMGYVESSGFQKDVSIFGSTTSSLDMYYIYVFFTTGIVGSAMILCSLILILYKILKRKTDSIKMAYLGVFVSMLFFAFWQVNLFTWRYISSFIVTVIFLAGMQRDCCTRKYVN